MADIKLTVDADYKEASNALKELANESEETRKKIEKFAASYDDKKITQFIDKQKLLEISLKGTRGGVAAMEAAQKNYQREIERLINRGLDPESDAVKKLRSEYEKLKTQTDSQKTASAGLSSKSVDLKSQLTAMVPAVGGMIAAYQGMSAAIQTAKQFMDDSINTYIESEKANARLQSVLVATGAQYWTTEEQLKSFAKELAHNTGNSTKDVQDMQSVLLGFRSITGDVFNDATSAIVQMSGVMGGDLKSAANSFGKALDTPIQGMASLSRYGFVFTEQEKEMVKELEAVNKHEEAQRVILNAMTGSFGDAASAVNNAALSQNNYNTAIEELKIAAGAEFEESVRPMRDFFTGIISDLANYMSEYRNLKEAQKAVEEGTADYTQKILLLSKEIERNREARKEAERSTEGFWDEELGRMVFFNEKTLEFYDQEFSALYKRMEVLQRAADQEEENRKKEQEAAAEKARQDAIKKENEEKEKERLEQLAKLREQDNKRLADSTQKNIEKLKELQLKNDDIINDEKQLLELQLKRQLASIEASEADVKEKEAAQKATEDLYREQIRLSEEKYNSISEQLKRMPLTEQQIQNQQIEQFKSFLQQRMDLQFENDELLNESEVEKAEKRIEFLKEQQELLLEQFEEGSAEYLAAQQASNAKIEQEEKRLSDAKLAIKKAELKATSGLFGALADLAEAAGEDSVAAAIASKALSSAQAAINSYLAFTQALHDPMIPSTIARIAMAATVLASGLAMQVKILSTPIPSAETGGRFIVPNSTGSDSGLMRVNPGEEVDITPRGMTGFGQGQTITVQIERQTIFDVVNDGIRSGDILIAAVNY